MSQCDSSRLPTHTLSKCIEMALDQGGKAFEEVVGDSIGAEFRKLVNGWEKKHRVRSDTAGGNSTKGARRNLGDALYSDKSVGAIDSRRGAKIFLVQCLFFACNFETRGSHLAFITEGRNGAPNVWDAPEGFLTTAVVATEKCIKNQLR